MNIHPRGNTTLSMLLAIMVLTGLFALPAAARPAAGLDDLSMVIRQLHQEFVDRVDSAGLVTLAARTLERKLLLAGAAPPPLPRLQANGDLEANLAELTRYWEALPEEDRRIRGAAACRSAQRALLRAMKDDGCELFLPGTYQESLEEQGYTQGGVGILVEEEKDAEGNFIIIETLKGFPADALGFKAGDRLTHVNGRAVAGISFKQLAEAVRGPIGTSVTLTIHREGEPRSRDYTIVRTWLNPNPTSVESRILAGNLGYVRIRYLGQHPEAEVCGILDQFKAGKVKGVLLDLRNSGGDVEGAAVLAEQFLNEGTLMVSKVFRDRVIGFRSANRTPCTLPLVCLVNEYSDSSGALLAAILQVSGRAQMVGSPTTWKSSISNVYSLNDNSVFTVTVGYYLLPGGRILRGKCTIHPSLIIPADPLAQSPDQDDLPLKAGLELLRRQVTSGG